MPLQKISLQNILYKNELALETPGQNSSQIVYDNLENYLPFYADPEISLIMYVLAKRIIDIFAAGLGLILSLPLMLFIAVLIKLDSPGSILFRQLRIGKNRRFKNNSNGYQSERRKSNLKGEPFIIYKFRTMRSETKNYATSPEDKSDPRITKVGKFLRTTCLDELPQFINVLKGDLSLVGPRPEMHFIVKKYNQLQARRLMVKPGLTGLWQLYGPRTHHIHKNLHYDLSYIENRSIKLDFIILLKTLAYMVNVKNI